MTAPLLQWFRSGAAHALLMCRSHAAWAPLESPLGRSGRIGTVIEAKRRRASPGQSFDWSGGRWHRSGTATVLRCKRPSRSPASNAAPRDGQSEGNTATTPRTTRCVECATQTTATTSAPDADRDCPRSNGGATSRGVRNMGRVRRMGERVPRGMRVLRPTCQAHLRRNDCGTPVARRERGGGVFRGNSDGSRYVADRGSGALEQYSIDRSAPEARTRKEGIVQSRSHGLGDPYPMSPADTI